jgi:hypothetical protein
MVLVQISKRSQLIVIGMTNYNNMFKVIIMRPSVFLKDFVVYLI